jgi:hypothetical protein
MLSMLSFTRASRVGGGCSSARQADEPQALGGHLESPSSLEAMVQFCYSSIWELLRLDARVFVSMAGHFDAVLTRLQAREPIASIRISHGLAVGAI